MCGKLTERLSLRRATCPEARWSTRRWQNRNQVQDHDWRYARDFIVAGRTRYIALLSFKFKGIRDSHMLSICLHPIQNIQVIWKRQETTKAVAYPCRKTTNRREITQNYAPANTGP